MNASVDVPFGVVHDVMDKVVADLVVTDCVIRVNLGPILNVLKKDVLQGLPRNVGDNLSTDLAQLPVEYPLHYTLSAVHSALLDNAQLAAFVHILGETPNERFICFHFCVRTTEFARTAKPPVVMCSAEPLKHKPSGLLSYAERAMYLHAGYSVLTIHKHPKSRHPLVQPEGRVLKYGPDFERELPVAVTTQPDVPSFYEVVFLGTAPWADNLAIGPTKLHSVIKRSLRIGEVNDGFL